MSPTQLFYVQFVFLVSYLVSFTLNYKLLIICYQSQNMEEFRRLNFREQSRQIYFFYIKLYFCVLSYNYLMTHFELDIILILANSLVLVPQFAYNIMSKQFPDFNFNFFTFCVLSRYLLFYYFRGCTRNIILLEPNFALASAGMVTLILSMGMVAL